MTTLTKLPKPLIDIECKTWRNSHIYLVGGVKYPSVTKVLGIIGGGKTNALMIWSRREALKLAQEELFKALDDKTPITYESVAEMIKRADRQPDKIKDASADLGTRVHNAIDAYILGQEPELDEQGAIGFKNFLSWLERERITLIAGDTPVVSVKLGFGGRLDAVGTNDKGDVIILDWKTSNALRDEYPLQVAGYALAFEEVYGIKPAGAKVVRFDKEDPTIFEAKPINFGNATAAWHAALALNNAMNTPLWEE